MRLTSAESKLARCKPNFFGFVNNAAEKREVAELRTDMAELDARLVAVGAEYNKANAAWHASGGFERSKAQLLQPKRPK